MGACVKTVYTLTSVTCSRAPEDVQDLRPAYCAAQASDAIFETQAMRFRPTADASSATGNVLLFRPGVSKGCAGKETKTAKKEQNRQRPQPSLTMSRLSMQRDVQ